MVKKSPPLIDRKILIKDLLARIDPSYVTRLTAAESNAAKA